MPRHRRRRIARLRRKGKDANGMPKIQTFDVSKTWAGEPPIPAKDHDMNEDLAGKKNDN